MKTNISKFFKKSIFWAMFIVADYYFFLFISFITTKPIFDKVANEAIKRWDKYGAITKADVAEYKTFINCSMTKTSQPYENIAMIMVVLTFIVCFMKFKSLGLKNILLKSGLLIIIHMIMAFLMFVILFAYHWIIIIVC